MCLYTRCGCLVDYRFIATWGQRGLKRKRSNSDVLPA
ncbi:hypothetical protein PITC_010220 [Penicillium italicum]|uniref:Uncharacterized protein n=1 Tax=Penicillium italicum TaxID=40296 RepID=A0A0A2LCD9_PENIT|nr:hypothetical protein PITC_010220 [Penicillium italicum]